MNVQQIFFPNLLMDSFSFLGFINLIQFTKLYLYNALRLFYKNEKNLSLIFQVEKFAVYYCCKNVDIAIFIVKDKDIKDCLEETQADLCRKYNLFTEFLIFFHFCRSN